MKEQIRVNFDVPNSPKIEAYDKVEDSLFGEIYKRAYSQINEIFEDANKLFPYNIIPIIGGRGSGKTSIALSVSEHLKNPEKIQNDGENLKYNFENKKFIILEHIDVGHLESGEDLFAIVLARMLGDFKKKARSADVYAEQEIYQKFSRLYNSYVNLSSMSANADILGKSALAVLSECDASQNLRELFKELVSELISFTAKQDGKTAEKDTFIVVTIDDIDVNVPNTYKMLEQIQNYMMIPNVIIILTASQQTLESVCKKNYVEHFKDAISVLPDTDMAQRGSFIESCNELGREYMNKILPTGKMIYLDVDDKYEFMISKTFIECGKGNIFVSSSSEDISYTKAILYKIQKATGIYFYAREDCPLFLEPKTLRAKGQYLDKIRNMGFVKSHRLNSRNKRQLQDMRDNLIIICNDIVRRHSSALSENQLKYLRGIMDADIDDFIRQLYISLKNLEDDFAKKEDYRLFPSEDDNADKISSISWMTSKFSDLVPYIDGLSKFYDDFKEYRDVVFSLFTIKLRIERINRFLKHCALNGNMSEDDELRAKREIDNLLICKYIGFGLFGKMENKMVNHLTLAPSGGVDPDYFGAYRLIGYKEGIETSVLNGENKIIQNFQLNMDYINAFAVFLMFLSSDEYSLTVTKRKEELFAMYLFGEEERNDIKMTIEFADRTSFSISAFFSNIRSTERVVDFYNKVKKAAEKWNRKNPENKISLNKLNAKRSEFIKRFNDIDIPYSVLNLELMYNIGCRVREKVQAKIGSGTPWEICCTFFEDFGNEFAKVQDYYSEMFDVNEDDDDTKKIMENDKNYIRSAPGRNRSSLFYLNENEAEEFNQIMNLFNWEQV